MKLSFYAMIHVGPIKILSSYQNLITLRNICRYAQFLSLYSQKRDRTERIKQWYGNLPSSPTGLYCRLIASMCLKKGKPLSQPQSLKSLALLLSTESRRKINKLFFIITQLLSESSLLYHYGNVSKINKGWFLQCLKKLRYLKLLKYHRLFGLNI